MERDYMITFRGAQYLKYQENDRSNSAIRYIFQSANESDSSSNIRSRDA